ncbi:MAG: site-2 protease family protein [Oscillospiraceae bacterium]|nr:site-2 protease family protein [Oscillospiraceae bacterium]
MLFIILAILAFGVIIAIHELGHFLSARIFNVKVNEFAIGMGPKLLKYQGKETLYSLRAVPFGGFCSMEGEHEEGEEPDPRSFLSQKRWKRIVILASGSIANFIAAFIIVLILHAGVDSFGGTTLTNVVDRFPEQGPSELMAGDRFVAMNGERLFYHDDFILFSQLNAGNPLTVTLERNGELIEYERRSYLVDGVEEFRYSLSFDRIDANLWETIKYSGYQTYSFVRMIRLSIAMMVSGAIGIGDFAGPVGIIDTMNTIGHQVQENESTTAAIGSIVFFTAFIGVNVAVINLLPIPAMDGGRIFFTVLTWIIEKITRKRLDPKYEGYINTTVFVLLIGFMIFILYNDVARIITR